MSSIVPREPMSLESKLSLLDKISDKINKKYGKTIVGRMGVNEEILDALSIKFIPTPSRELNAAVGGGLPRRRCTIITGISDSGKTSLVLETAAMNMKADPNFVTAWLESEHSLEKDYICNTFGIDPDRFFYIKFDPSLGAEETLDLVQSVLESGAIDLFCINSLRALVPTKELEGSIADAQVAIQARMNSRMTKKFTALVAEHDTAFVIITHLSTDIGTMSRDPLVLSGGHAIRYWSALTLDLRRRSIGPGDLINKEEGVKIGVTVRKNHCTPAVNPYVKLDYYAIFGEGIEQILSSLEEACNMGIAESRGAWVYWYDSNGEVKQKWNGRAEFRKYMKDNPEVFKEFTAALSGETLVESLSDEEISVIEQEEAIIEDNANLEEKKTKKKKKES